MKISHDYYLIVDVEATCDDDGSVPQTQMEIIEIGAVMLNARSLKIESEFQTFVKPTLHSQLTEFCKSLTSITQVNVDESPLFPQAIKSFQAWFYPFGNYQFCSWGNYDKNQFLQDCQLHNIGYPFSGSHFNLKQSFSDNQGITKKLGMHEALNKLDLKLEGTHHRGIDDARNMARIVRTVLS